ncbi:MAG: ssDNA endonuclease and repair protein rad10 [Stictis urceolatum]|nr:ssDNA endonuclease and repair protein rad10 [Stictis urceolata]
MDDDDFSHDVDLTALAEAAERSVPPPLPRGRSNPQTSNSNSKAPKVVQPTPQALPARYTVSALLVSTRQKGNPLLTHIHSLPWEYTDTPADYVLGATSCALFLSLKYHRLHPEYIYTRMRSLGKSYDLRVLLTLVDIDAHEEPLRELAKTSLVNNYTLILAWSAREAARYLEAYKAMERAAPTAIKGQQTSGYAEKMVEFVTVPRGVNKADAVGIVSAFGSVRAAVNTHSEELAAVQGWGEVKVKRWSRVVREPFRAEKAGKKESRTGTAFTSVALPRQNTLGTESTLGREDTMGSEIDPGEGPTSQVRAWEPGEDDGGAIVAAAEQEGGLIAPEDDAAAPAAKRPRYEDPKLDDGIASALAKFRSG